VGHGGGHGGGGCFEFLLSKMKKRKEALDSATRSRCPHATTDVYQKHVFTSHTKHIDVATVTVTHSESLHCDFIVIYPAIRFEEV
jgi:hypothetical protein